MFSLLTIVGTAGIVYGFKVEVIEHPTAKDVPESLYQHDRIVKHITKGDNMPIVKVQDVMFTVPPYSALHPDAKNPKYNSGSQIAAMSKENVDAATYEWNHLVTNSGTGVITWYLPRILSYVIFMSPAVKGASSPELCFVLSEYVRYIHST